MPIDNTPTICTPQPVKPPLGLDGSDQNAYNTDRCIAITFGSWKDDLLNNIKVAEVDKKLQTIALLTLGGFKGVGLVLDILVEKRQKELDGKTALRGIVHQAIKERNDESLIESVAITTEEREALDELKKYKASGGVDRAVSYVLGKKDEFMANKLKFGTMLVSVVETVLGLYVAVAVQKRSTSVVDYQTQLMVAATAGCTYMTHDPMHGLFACNAPVPFSTWTNTSCYISSGAGHGSSVAMRLYNNSVIVFGGVRYTMDAGLSYKTHASIAEHLTSSIGFLGNNNISNATINLICGNNSTCINYLGNARNNIKEHMLDYDTGPVIWNNNPKIFAGITIKGGLSKPGCDMHTVSDVGFWPKGTYLSCGAYWNAPNEFDKLTGMEGDALEVVRPTNCPDYGGREQIYLEVTCDKYYPHQLLGGNGVLFNLLDHLLHSDAQWVLPYGMSSAITDACSTL